MTGESRDALSEARETIARQSAEIDDLRRRLGDQRFVDALRDALAVTAAAGTLASPVSHARLLEMIVETAAQVISARAGSLFLIDEAAQELIFEVAIGPKASEVRRFRVPLGQGVAGLVAVTGQPMAVSDAQRDPRHAAHIAREIGYLPESILCVPLVYGDEIIGVLELLDKQGAPSFSPGDMQTLGLFARQAAVAIEQSRAQRDIGRMLGDLLRPHEAGLRSEAGAVTERLEDDPSYRRTLDLALLVREIAARGEREHQACRVILQGFADYLAGRAAAGADLFAAR